MKSLLFTLGLALCCFLQAEGDETFGLEHLHQVEGNYYMVAMDNGCKMLKEKVSQAKVTPVAFKQEGEDLHMTMDLKMPNGCKEIPMVLQKNVNGRYQATCKQGGTKTMGKIEIKDNAIFTIVIFGNEKFSCITATLLVKDLADTQKYLKDFEDFAKRNGLEGKNIYVLPTEGMCPRSS